ncbi:MAG TPA: hypothetical protein VKK81_23230 [Candidatus Binatia bacterium]|nr:hypothetical protein [Candidatus Binatia bacterium]
MKTDRWAIGELVPQITEMDSVGLALRLTLLALLLRPIGNWMIRPLILGLAALGVALPGLLRKPWLWFTLAVLTGLRVVLDWQLADNHGYLLCYWCLAIALALVSRDTCACLALNGRLLIGWAFAFATLWKLALSPDYLDGRFFRVLLLTDLRFAEFAQLAGGLTLDSLESLREFVTQHVDGQLFAVLNPPREPARFLWLARCMTWWTVILEGAIAIVFLWPAKQRLSTLRDALLLTFCATVYAVAPVEGFGWLLIALGVAQCDPARRRPRFLYLAVFALILFYREIPPVEWLAAFSHPS